MRWRILYSLWLIIPLLGIFCVTGGLGLLIIGIRARRQSWSLSGIFYIVAMLVSIGLYGSFERETTPSRVGLYSWGIFFLICLLHSCLVNSSWLRFQAFRRGPAVAPGLGPLPPGGFQRPRPGTPVLWTRPLPPTPPPPAAPPAWNTSGFPAPRSGPPFPMSPVSAPPPMSPVSAPPPVSPTSAAPFSPAASGQGPIEVNTATVDELATLPGFGVDRARRVERERTLRGGFATVSDFVSAAGLAPHEYARIRQYVTCVPPAEPPDMTEPGQGDRILDV